MGNTLKSLTESTIIFALIFIFIIAFTVFTQSPNEVLTTPGESTALTIYTSGIAIVKDTRTETLAKGQNYIRFTGISQGIIPESATLNDLTDKETQIFEQDYSYDLLSASNLLEKYENKEITIITRTPEKESITGTLLKYENGKAILKDSTGAIHIIESSEATLPELPEDLTTDPALSILVDSKKSGNHTLELSYMTDSISWSADYIATVSEDEKKTSLSSWVTVINNAGTDFKQANLKLVAGDINRVSSSPIYAEESAVKSITTDTFTEQQLFEFHSYTLDRAVTIKNRQQKQLSLFDAEEIPVKKEYIYDPQRRFYWETEAETKVKTMISFTNSEESDLGIPMPEGIVRVYKEDASGNLDFIGEDTISHTPKGEEIRLFLGYAFDITAEKKKTKISRISDDVTEESYEVTVTNRKTEPITVTIVEHPYGDWEIIETSEDYETISATQVEWQLSIPQDTKETLTYTIRYSA